MPDSYTCQSCKKPKAKVSKVKSRLLPTHLLLCDECKSKGYEPRYAIIIAGRSDLSEKKDSVAPYIKKHLYVGPDILASELMA